MSSVPLLRCVRNTVILFVACSPEEGDQVQVPSEINPLEWGNKLPPSLPLSLARSLSLSWKKNQRGEEALINETRPRSVNEEWLACLCCRPVGGTVEGVCVGGGTSERTQRPDLRPSPGEVGKRKREVSCCCRPQKREGPVRDYPVFKVDLWIN